ncbi:MAG TPA: DUF4198 domain-containing protein [Roseomonas sp.]|jgi:hypothetical protein
MKLRSMARLMLAATLVMPLSAAQAARMWMLPTVSVIGGNDPWVSVDAAISNDLFTPEFPLPLDGLTVIAPDGTAGEATNPQRGQIRSTFDVHLRQPGTYRFASVVEDVSAFWMQDGQRRRWRGTREALATEVPANAQQLRVTLNQRRVETYATRGAPSQGALRPVNKGLELVPVTHPTDLVAGEAARFRLLLDGQPARDLEVTVVPGESRYRNAANEVKLRTDADGMISITWPAAGRYWLGASVRDTNSGMPNVGRVATYATTFEVLP